MNYLLFLLQFNWVFFLLQCRGGQSKVCRQSNPVKKWTVQWPRHLGIFNLGDFSSISQSASLGRFWAKPIFQYTVVPAPLCSKECTSTKKEGWRLRKRQRSSLLLGEQNLFNSLPLAILIRTILKNRMKSSLSFKSSWYNSSYNSNSSVQSS